MSDSYYKYNTLFKANPVNLFSFLIKYKVSTIQQYDFEDELRNTKKAKITFIAKDYNIKKAWQEQAEQEESRRTRRSLNSQTYREMIDQQLPEYRNQRNKAMIHITKGREQKQIRMNTMMESGMGSLLKYEPPSQKDLLQLKNQKFGGSHQLSPAPQFNQKKYKFIEAASNNVLIPYEQEKNNKDRLESKLHEIKYKNPLMHKIERNLIRKRNQKDHIQDYEKQFLSPKKVKQPTVPHEIGNKILGQIGQSYDIKTGYKDWKRLGINTRHTEIFKPPKYENIYRFQKPTFTTYLQDFQVPQKEFDNFKTGQPQYQRSATVTRKNYTENSNYVGYARSKFVPNHHRDRRDYLTMDKEHVHKSFERQLRRRGHYY